MKLHWFSKFFVVCAIVLAVVPASAQTALSGSIAGVVRDISGGVLPGVTVEASNPALIERTPSWLNRDSRKRCATKVGLP
jgi:hypothetical protein